MHSTLHVFLSVVFYTLGAVLLLYLQMVNSIKSPSNGLGKRGITWADCKQWLCIQQPAIIARAFLQVILYVPSVQLVMKQVAPVLEHLGLTNYEWGYAGIAGLGWGAIGHQIVGLIPGLRKEIPEEAPTKELAERRAGDSDAAPQP